MEFDSQYVPVPSRPAAQGVAKSKKKGISKQNLEIGHKSSPFGSFPFVFDPTKRGIDIFYRRGSLWLPVLPNFGALIR